MDRLKSQLAIAGLMLSGTLACTERRPPVQEPPTPAAPKPTAEPRKPMQGCATRFALGAPQTRGDAETCTLPQDSPKGWRLIAREAERGEPAPQGSDPNRPSQNAPQQKSPGPKGGDQSAGAAAVPTAPESPWRIAPGGTPFCVYEWQGSEMPGPDDFKRAGAEPECGLAFGAAGDGATDAGPGAKETRPEPALVRAFERQGRGLDEAGARAAREILKANLKGAPRVAVLDASPFGIAEPDDSGHGFAVSRTIAALACADPESAECGEMIRPYVALPLVRDAAGTGWVVGPRGGRFGYFHHLFRRFEAALAQRAPGQNLIVNLSLGWDPVKTDPNGREVTLMNELLQRAHCEGVLVIAAAGNRTGSEGPIMPAAIEAAPPDAKRCEALADPKAARKAAAAGGYRPLVHSVGGVDIRDERLVSSRPWGNPRLAAYGMEVTVPASKTSTGYTTPMTGTSMSAAVVSGIAAAVWTVKPKLDPHEVIALIYKTGRLLDGKAGNRLSRTEFCLDEPTGRCEKWPPRRASYCEALRAASGKSLGCISPAEKLPPDLFPPDPSGDEKPSSPPPAAPPCRIANCGVPFGPMGNQLPEGVLPQPGLAACPGCTLRRNAFFNLGKAYGTATSIPPAPLTTVVRSWTWVYPWGWTPQDFWIPNPSLNVPFAHYLGTPPTTLQAEMLWTYPSGPVWVTDSTPLVVE